MLSLKGLKWTAEDGAEILKGIDMEVGNGKLTIVTGPNGGGKTSLAKVISGVKPTGRAIRNFIPSRSAHRRSAWHRPARARSCCR